MNKYDMNKRFEKILEEREYISTYLKAECFGLVETFFVIARKHEYCIGAVEIEFLLKEEKRYDEFPIYRCCDKIQRDIPFDLESVINYAESYLNEHAVEMYALFRRRVKASKPGISYTKKQMSEYDVDRVCITIPCDLLGYDVCEIIEMFDNHKIIIDEEANVVKIFQSVIFNTNVDYYGKQIKGIREHETKVIRPKIELNKKEVDPEEKEKIDKNFEEEKKKIMAMFKIPENKNEEITTSPEEEVVLI